MRYTRSSLFATSLIVIGCAHAAYGPSSDDRLTAAVKDTAEAGAPPGHETIQSCDDLNDELGKARNGERPEVDRLRSYMSVFHDLSERLASNEKVFSRKPELVYGGGKGQAVADQARGEQDKCTQLTADARSELEVLVRDLFQPLIITDLANGKRRIARISFNLLRSAIQELDLTDKDSLLDRLSAAEKVLDPSPYHKR